MNSKGLLLPLVFIISASFVALVSSDFNQDKKQCQDQLVGLSSCIGFVSGSAKFPSATCCNELHKDYYKSKLCLCILIKDRNEPSLGFKLNVTLASNLIPMCKVKSNTTRCQELLHIDPNSPEAEVFDQIENNSTAVSSTSSTESVPSTSTGSSSKGLKLSAVGVVLSWIIIQSVFIIIV